MSSIKECEYKFGFESGSYGYNNLSCLILQPIDDQLVTYTIIINNIGL